MSPLLGFIGMPGPMEIGIIGVVAILLFGNRLPSVMRSVGQCLPAFKSGLEDYKVITEEIRNEVESVTKQA